MSIAVPIHGFGGGVPLNFKVVAGTTRPSNPAENTIWVNTASMSSWVFSPSKPSNPTEGMVWIVTGTSSFSAFNVLKKNELLVYPIYLEQYTNGAFKDVEGAIYQNGQWSELILDTPSAYWVNKGVVNENYGKSLEVGTSSKFAFDGPGYFIHTLVGGSSAYMRSSEKVDVSKAKTLVLKCEEQTGGTVIVGLSNSSSVTSLIASGEKVTTGSGVIRVDIEAITGSYYLVYKGIGSAGSTNDMAKIADIYWV